jgi:hypothetical protein
VISSAGAATFVIAYGKNTRDGQLIYRDIEAVKVDLAGNVLQHLAITDSKTDGKDFNTPVVAQMQNDDVFLAYHAQWAEDALEYNQIHYTVIHPQASAVDEPSVLDVNGKSLYVTPFTNGNILLAWIQTDALGIAYQIFDPTGVPQAGVWPKAFNGVMGREIKNISMTGEINGNVVITWIDQWGYYLSYALMAQDGSLVTPPMTFLRGSDPVSPNILVSNTGRGVAQLENMLTWQVFMPAVKRQ